MGVSIAVAIGMVTAVCSVALIADHQQRAMTILNTVTLGLNVALNLALIPRYEATGAAAALVMSEFVGLLVCCWLMARRIGNFVPARLLVRLVPALAICLVVEYTVLQVVHGVMRVLIVGAVYAAGLLAFRAVDVTEVRRLLSRTRG